MNERKLFIDIFEETYKKLGNETKNEIRRIILADKKTKESNEAKKCYNIKSFQDATKEEIRKYLYLYDNAEINLLDYWKVGDIRYEECGVAYIIANTVYCNVRTYITILRLDLIDTCLWMNPSNSLVRDFEFKNSIVDKFLKDNADWILGNTFKDIAFKNSLKIPTATEVFGDGYYYNSIKDGYQFEYFKDKNNRNLNGNWWTRTCNSTSLAEFAYCNENGEIRWSVANKACGLVPCFKI